MPNVLEVGNMVTQTKSDNKREAGIVSGKMITGKILKVNRVNLILEVPYGWGENVTTLELKMKKELFL